MSNKKNKNIEINKIILDHFIKNFNKYTILIAIFLIGLIIGVIFINNTSSEHQTEITSYITNFVNLIKEKNNIDKMNLFIRSIKSNLFTAAILWISGSTVIGIPIICGIIGYRGFCIGYGISSIIVAVGTKNGAILSLSSMLIHNIIFIPSMLVIAASGINLYNAIIKDKRRESIKLEIYRHTILTIIMSVMLIISSIIETYISSTLVSLIIRYI